VDALVMGPGLDSTDPAAESGIGRAAARAPWHRPGSTGATDSLREPTDRGLTIGDSHGGVTESRGRHRCLSGHRLRPGSCVAAGRPHGRWNRAHDGPPTTPTCSRSRTTSSQRPPESTALTPGTYTARARRRQVKTGHAVKAMFRSLTARARPLILHSQCDACWTLRFCFDQTDDESSS
jgi:hypothetical protein